MQPDKSGLPKAGVISLLLHIALIIFLSFNLRATISKSDLSVYRVTLRPFSPLGNEIPRGGSSPSLPGPSGGLPAHPATEKPKPENSQKEKENTPTVKLDQKKAKKKVEKPAKAEVSLAPKKQKTSDTKEDQTPTKEKEAEKALQERIAEIQHKVAVEEIEKQVESRGTTGEGVGILSGSSSEEAGGGYWGKVKDKINKEWTLPKNFPKKEKSLETIIDIVIGEDGKVKKSWFEKKSGNDLYDQMAMRAITKAEPFPPIPKGSTDNTRAFRFTPDQLAK